ncbi:segregation and condensation protein B [Azorhizobium oxalatiphilum]|uniref:Segregation and condensation protein B n=1 Tax=Azorhizobium oxalatiphilum TaxID=980631 RepID=A0A917C4S7_9HYPH|nr:SMC-Scp complex subunit ScpB [Azorhizobium oxalatiphilum]GGF72090.1 segregation and condensation protein B [Azorhizobium oxalatiphilum]
MNRAAPRVDLFDVRPDDERAVALARDLRIIEALLFTSGAPLEPHKLAAHLPEKTDIEALMDILAADYSRRGVNLVKAGGGWMLRTAPDLAPVVSRGQVETRKLSRAAVEVLAIVAYHQPVTRAEIEDIRGVSTSKGTLDLLLESGWVRLRGRRKAPGRPVTYGTTPAFLTHFGLDALQDLPGLDELRGAGLLDGRIPPGFTIPLPSDDAALRDDEEALEKEPLDLALAPLLDYAERDEGDGAGDGEKDRDEGETE